MVLPGDQLHLHAKVERRKMDIWKFEVRAEVNSGLVCNANITLAKAK